MKLYLCKRESGRWCTAREEDATIPPFEIVDGPYDSEQARDAVDRRNQRYFPWKNIHKTDTL